MNNYLKLESIIPLFFLLFFINCKGSTEQKITSNHQKNKSIDSTNTTSSSVNDSIYWELTDITRFFEKPIEETDLNVFKSLKVRFYGDTLIINENKAVFVKHTMNSKKYFGKGSLYVYFTDYLLNKFNINIKDNITFIELDHENARKKPFNHYFLKNDAVYAGNYLFLYSSDDYILTFEKQINKIIFKEIYNNLNTLSLPLKYSFDFIINEPNFIKIPETYQNLLKLDDFDNYSAIKLPKIGEQIKPVLLSAYNVAGQSILYLYTFSENYNFLDKLELYYSYDTEKGNIVTIYEIDEKYHIKIKRIEHKNDDKEKIIENRKYIINKEGKFEEVK
jgi:hypothetical protein